MQGLPGRRITSFGYTVPGVSDDKIAMTAFGSDHDIVKTLGLDLVAGRDFSKEFGTDSAAFILNEAAVQFLGWDDPIGREFGVDYFNKMGSVVGVVENFHFASLHQTIQPVVLQVMPEGFYAMMAVRVLGENIPETLAFLQSKWQQFAPDYPFEYYFSDKDFDRLYRAEERLGQIFRYFSLLAILVACLGLFGLTYFSSEQRLKEIGVRKVFGASVSGIVLLLTKDFTKLIIIAFFVAVPLAYFSMSRWLQNFAYRIDIGWGTFLLAGIFALVISWLTVAYHTIKAAQANPVESIQYE